MADIPLHWRAYAAHQANLNNRTSVDATSWGLEEGLNHLLGDGNLGTDAPNVDRVIANAARRDRYARSLVAKNIIARIEVHDTTAQIEARSRLSICQQQMPSDKFGLLVELAIGTKLTCLAERHGIAVGALRTRISRARVVARDIAA